MSVGVARALRGLLVSVVLMASGVTTVAAVPVPGENTKQEKAKTPLIDAARKAMAEVPEKSWKVSARGTFDDRIPIAVPEFRTITPQLALSYESSAGNGWAGVGWNLDGVSEIERGTAGRGAPRYDATDGYYLDGEELVPCAAGSASPSCTTGGTHSTKTESYQRIVLSGTGSNSQWTVTAKDGTKRIYTQVYSAATDLVFRWGLSQVIDTKNNTVTYNWARDQFGCCWEYLDSVAYNGVTVKLYYETRPDNDQSAVGNGGLATVRGRIKTIDVTVGGNRLRAYKLTYATSGATSRSLLTSVQQFGRDAVLDGSATVTGGTSLPAITAGYQAGSPAFVSGTSDTAMGGKTDARFLPMDINGDGRTDILELRPGTYYVRESWISNGTGFTLTSSDNGIGYHPESHFLTGDVNGDGKSDLIEFYPNGGKWGRRLWISNGTGFTLAATGSSQGRYDPASRFLAMDIDGDGKTDVLELSLCGLAAYCRAAWISTGTDFTLASNDSGIGYDPDRAFYAADINGDGKSDLLELGVIGRRVWLSTGTAFTEGATDSGISWSVPKGDGSGSRFLVMDVNGDDKTDMVELYPFLTSYTRRTWLSTGYGFALASSDTAMPQGNSAKHLAVDVNGDQRMDIVEIAPFGLGTRRRVWLSTGTGFVLGATDNAMAGYSCTKGVCGSEFLDADVNGDGLTEMVELSFANFGLNKARHVWTIGGSLPDMLTSRTSEWGGTTAVSYTPSSAWPNTNNPPLTPTASAVTIGDGRGGSATTSYSYTGGAYNSPERRFLGFRQQKETQPCITGETTCPTTETLFRQDMNALMKPERVDRRSASGMLLSSTIQEYTTNGATLPWTALQIGTWENTYVNSGAACPGADCKRKHTSRQFNAYGEITQQTEHGDNELAGDERTTATTFVPNTTAYIVNKPADEKLFQGNGTSGVLLTGTRTSYDNAANWNQAPSAGFATNTARWLSSNNSFVETGKEYDSFGNVTAEIDPLSGRTSHEFDPAYHLYAISETNALSQRTTAAWDVVCGYPSQTTDLNDQATTMAYDALCRPVEKTAPGGRFERYRWFNVGNAATQYEQVERQAADGTDSPQWSRSYVDGLRRAWRTADKGPDAATGDIYVDTAYNSRGQIASKTAAYYWVSGQPQPTTYPTINGYDALDRLTRVTAPGGAFQTRSYGLWSVTSTDELGHATTDRNNADGKRVAHDQTVGGAVKTATYDYDARGNLAQSTDPAGNMIVYVTDSLGRKTQMTDPDAGVMTYEYDDAGRLTAQTDAKSQRTTFSYDALDRKTGKTTNAGTGSAVTVSWTYDQVRAGYQNIGQLTTMTDGAGTKTSDYDALGRAVRTVRTIGGTAYTFRFGFDTGSRLLWTTYPDGDTVGTDASPLRYDSAGRLIAIPGYVTSARYTADGKLTRIDNANGAVTTRPYDPQRGWLNGITTTSGATTVQDTTYARNAKGMITRITSPVGDEGWTYDYDEADQLTSATNTSNAAYNQTLTYDGIGNITANPRVGAYTYGTTRPHAVSAAGPNSYTYDAAGLMSSGAGRILTWDGDNRLASVTQAGTTSTFTYDAEGARIQQVVGATTRRYLGDNYEINVSAGSTTKYIAIAGTLVARVDGTTRYWVHTDQQGSIQAETDAAGVEVLRRKYGPYGEILATSGSLSVEPRGFTGQRQDATGLVYLKARYYDPRLGRFISPDPIIDGDAMIGLNRYAYAANDPVDHTDITGMACVKSNSGIRYGVPRCKEDDTKRDWAEAITRKIIEWDWDKKLGWILKEAVPKLTKKFPPIAVAQAAYSGWVHQEEVASRSGGMQEMNGVLKGFVRGAWFTYHFALTFLDEETLNIGGSIRSWWDSRTGGDPHYPVYPIIGQVGGCKYVIFCS